MDSNRAAELLSRHIDPEDMPLFSQAAAMGIAALERVAALEEELAAVMRSLVAIGHKLSIENAEQFHTAAYAQGRITDAIIERSMDGKAELAEARNHSEQYRANWLALLSATGEECHLRGLDVIAEVRKDRDLMKARLDWLILKCHWTSEQMHLGPYAAIDKAREKEAENAK